MLIPNSAFSLCIEALATLLQIQIAANLAETIP
jgi:hypothetical protein